jgi:ribonuclease inhibitor
MPINHCILDGSTISSLNDLYNQLSIRLTLPEHFGHNLDALWDVLSTDIEGPLEIVWKHAKKSQMFMDKDFDRVVTLLRDLEKVREDFTLRLETQ